MLSAFTCKDVDDDRELSVCPANEVVADDKDGEDEVNEEAKVVAEEHPSILVICGDDDDETREPHACPAKAALCFFSCKKFNLRFSASKIF